MPSKARAADEEAEARAAYSSLDDAGVVPVTDEQGRESRLSPNDTVRAILRRSRLIGASDCLVRAVVVRLGERGVDAQVHQVRADPLAADPLAADGRGLVQVMALRCGGRVVPVRPGATVLRVWPDFGEVELGGRPLAEVRVEPDPDGWVPAERIAEALEPHLG